MLNDKAQKLIKANIFNQDEMRIIDELEYFSEKIAQLVLSLRLADYYHRAIAAVTNIPSYIKSRRLKDVYGQFLIIELKTIYETNGDELSLGTFISNIKRTIKDNKMPNILSLIPNLDQNIEIIRKEFVSAQKAQQFSDALRDIKIHRNTTAAHKDRNPKNPQEIKDLYLDHFYVLVLLANNTFYKIIELFGFNDDIKNENKFAIEMEVYQEFSKSK